MEQDNKVVLGDCRKSAYRIAQDVRLPSRSVAGSIAEHCGRRRDEEGDRKDQQGSMRFDRNRLNSDRCETSCRSARRSEAVDKPEFASKGSPLMDFIRYY
jgi:hypothetical protein